MNPLDTTAPRQTESLSFEFDLHHAPEKVWRALTDPVLLAEWLLPVVDLDLGLAPGAAFTFKTQPLPGWDGTVRCRILESEARRKLSYAWVVGDMELDTVVTFTLTPTASGTRLSLVQSGFAPDQKQNFGGARYGWKSMGGKLVDLDTVVTFTLTPTASGTRLSLVQSGFRPDQKQNFGGARYGWKLMGGKLADLLERIP